MDTRAAPRAPHHSKEDDGAVQEEVVEEGVEAPAATGETNTDAAAGNKAIKSSAKKKAKARPAAPVAIGTWFKFGAGPDALSQDQDACMQSLGEKHRIVAPENLVTPEMRVCLKERGWFGIEKVE